VPSRDLDGDHDEFVQDEGGEGDGDDVEEFGFEEDDGTEHDGAACESVGGGGKEGKETINSWRRRERRRKEEREERRTLINRNHQPSEERLITQAPSLRQLLVQLRVEKRDVLVDVSVEDEGEDGEHGIRRCVTDHQPALVDCDGGADDIERW
jgi:hypothetical protein